MTETSSFAASGAAADRQRANLVWIASYPKSGNTWMRTFLWHVLRPAGGTPEDDRDLSFLRRFGTTDSGHVDLFERFLGKPLVEATFDEVAAVRPRVQATVAAAADGLVAIKTHSALGVAHGAATIDLSLTAAVIYLVRNPLDVAVSLGDHFGTSIDLAIERMAMQNCMVSNDDRSAPEFWGSWSQNVGSWTGAPNPLIMPVRYEDMLAAPQAVFRAVVRFLHQQPGDARLAAAINASSFQTLHDMEERSGFHETVRQGQQFFRRGRAGGWREVLTPDQVGRIVGAHHVQMRRVGYLTPDLMQYVPESAR